MTKTAMKNSSLRTIQFFFPEYKIPLLEPFRPFSLQTNQKSYQTLLREAKFNIPFNLDVATSLNIDDESDSIIQANGYIFFIQTLSLLLIDDPDAFNQSFPPFFFLFASSKRDKSVLTSIQTIMHEFIYNQNFAYLLKDEHIVIHVFQLLQQFPNLPPAYLCSYFRIFLRQYDLQNSYDNIEMILSVLELVNEPPGNQGQKRACECFIQYCKSFEDEDPLHPIDNDTYNPVSQYNIDYSENNFPDFAIDSKPFTLLPSQVRIFLKHLITFFSSNKNFLDTFIGELFEIRSEKQTSLIYRYEVMFSLFDYFQDANPCTLR